VGEPKSGQVRSRWLQITGWTGASLLFFIFFATSEAAIVASAISPVRILTVQQRSVIQHEAALLAPHFRDPNENILNMTVVSIDTPEANQYASQIMDAFRDGNIVSQSTWDGHSMPIPMRTNSMSVQGVIIQVLDPKKPPQLAREVRRILNDAHIHVAYYYNYGLPDWGFVLTIGIP
jgi:hypothetical protein